jgi:hypothetical protein
MKTRISEKLFGVDVTFLPTLTPPDYPGILQVIIDGGVGDQQMIDYTKSDC